MPVSAAADQRTGERGEKSKKTPWLTLHPSTQAVLLHITGRVPQHRLREVEEDIFHKRESNSSFQNRKHGLYCPSGNHSHQDPVESGFKTL